MIMAVYCLQLILVRELYNARVTFPHILLNLSSLFCYPLSYFWDKHKHQSVFYCLVILPVILQAVIRVRFPDDYILEAKFQPSETIQTLVNLLVKVVAQPNLPFYLCKYWFILLEWVLVKCLVYKLICYCYVSISWYHLDVVFHQLPLHQSNELQIYQRIFTQLVLLLVLMFTSPMMFQVCSLT